MSQTILFDGDHVEQLAEVTERPRRLKGSELLWVDVDRESERDVRRIAEAFEIGRFDMPSVFWVVVAVIVAVAPLVLAIAKRRQWI